MANFAVRQGQFWLDDQPLLLQAGEFHYFRSPAEQWRQRLGLLKDAGFNAVATYIPWLWHEVTPGAPDLDGHTHPVRNLAGFLDLAAEMGFWLIPRPGPYIMAETINEGIPPWVFSRYPQAAFVSQGGIVQNLASYLHPDFLACVRSWYQAVFAVLAPRQVTRGGRIVLVQLDNEMGMMMWVRNIFDANPDTVARFGAHLRQAHGPRLAERYPAADLEALLRESLLDPQPPYAALVAEDYRAFYRDYLRDYAACLWAEARACGLEVPPVINIHGFMNGGKTFPIGLSQLVKVMRLDGMLSATDVYPLGIGEGNYHQLLMVNAMTKALDSPEQPLMSMEFQSGGIGDFDSGQSSFYDLHTRLCLASGMRGINHYLFCSGENDPILSPVRRHDWGHPVRADGSLRRHYHRYPRLSRVLAAYGPALTLAQPETVTTIGFVLDHFMTEVNNAFTQDRTRILAHQREAVLFDFLARGLALTHRPFDALDLDRAPLDPGQTPLCWAMSEQACAAGTQRKLVDYLKQGGRLILAGRMPVEDFSHEPCTILRDALGVHSIASDPPFAESAVDACGYRDVPAAFVETYTGDFEAVFATRSGEAVGFIKSVGQGKAMMLGAAVRLTTLEDLDLVQQMALRMDCPSAFKLSQWADVHMNLGEMGSFLFANNYQDDPVETTIEHHGRLLFGGQPVHIPARQGVILPIGWQFTEGIRIDWLTSEVIEVRQDPNGVTLKTAQPSFVAELTLSGFGCDQSQLIQDLGAAQRVRVQSISGQIRLNPNCH